MNPGLRIAIAALAALALVPAPIVADAGVSSETLPSADVDEVDLGSAAAQANNTTVRHRNPDDVDENGDLQGIEAWLAGRMGERLTESSIRLSEGEYQLARQVVSAEYRRQLGKYVDVAGETEEATDDRAGEAFDRARDRQEALASDVESYRETREAYEQAKAAGDETRARALARELDRIADDVNASAGNLTDSYEVISNGTAANLDEAETNVETVAENVTEQQAEIRAAEFVATELTATAGSDRASFADPATVSGRLTDANGSALANRSVVLATGGRTVGATTDADGRFALEFRPTLVPPGDATLTLRYVPADASIYLGSTATVDVVVERVEPAIELSNATEEAAFGDPVLAAGSLDVDGVGVPDVPLVVEVGGAPIGTVETSADGSFAFEGSLPADVRPGERTLRVRQLRQDVALAPANASAGLTVERTETALSVDAASDGRTVTVSGELLTADGEPIGGRTVRIAVNESTSTTATTGEDGSFQTVVDAPASLVAAGERATVVVSATFDGSGTNLDGASANATVAVTAPDDQAGDPGGDGASAPGGDGPLGVPTWAWLALAGGLVLAGLGVVAFRGRSGTPEAEPTRESPDEPTTEGPDDGPSLVVAARQRLRDGRPEEAVRAAYGAARRRLGDSLDLATARTHWEFYRDCRDAGLDGGRLAALRRLTEGYERATFTPDRIAEDEAADAVGAAGELTEPARSAPPSDD